MKYCNNEIGIPTLEQIKEYIMRKEIIDKVCIWLEQHQDDYNSYDAWNGYYVNFNSLICDLRKAMEE